jgi:PAS domain S-box-containing protein
MSKANFLSTVRIKTIMNDLPISVSQTHAFQFNVKKRSDRLMNYFLASYFLVGLILAEFYGTWLIAIGMGGLLLIVYYTVKIALPGSSIYQYVLSAVLGLFMIQFIYQTHGLFEMHFFAFIGSALLITYQKWKLQIPILIMVTVQHTYLGYLQHTGFTNVYFTHPTYFTLHTFPIHILLSTVIFFVSGLWAYQLRKYNQIHTLQTIQMADLQKEAQLSVERGKNAAALEERNTILESITDAFFAVDNNWMITYWNNMAEKVLGKLRNETLGYHLWKVYADSIESESYRKYHEAMETGSAVHFEDYYSPMDKWYEISAYPSTNGLSVYFKDITERKHSEILLTASEKRYSELFHLSPLPMLLFDLDTLQFLDVNEATINHYGYSRQEFLAMTLRDIKLADDIPEMEKLLHSDRLMKKTNAIGNFRHKKKNGNIINVDIQANFIEYKGKEAKVIVVNDVTERLTYIQAIENQNEKLKEISWMQSHVMRAPLAKIIALIPLIHDEKENIIEREKMLNYLSISANELDKVIETITDKTCVVEIHS